MTTRPTNPGGAIPWQSYTYGQLLQALAKDLQLDASTDLLSGTILAVVFEGARAVSWGLVNGATATIQSGSGDFTVTRSAAGTYVVTNSHWSTKMAVLITPTNSGGGTVVANVNGISAGQFGVTTFLSNTGALVDTFFSFIAASP